MTRFPFLSHVAAVYCLSMLVMASTTVEAASQATARPQTQDFDVVSVRPSSPANGDTSGMTTRNNSLEARNVTLERLIEQAFALRHGRILGLPGWATQKQYDVIAKDTALQPGIDLPAGQQRLRLQSLLKERFGLTWHIEDRSVRVYDLTLWNRAIDADKKSLHQSKDDQQAHEERGLRIKDGYIEGHDLPLSSLTKALSTKLERDVVDQTNLGGSYDFTVQWAPSSLRVDAIDEDAHDIADMSDSAAPTLFDALKHQLGLGLTPGKDSLPTLVIDSVTQPTPN